MLESIEQQKCRRESIRDGPANDTYLDLPIGCIDRIDVQVQAHVPLQALASEQLLRVNVALLGLFAPEQSGVHYRFPLADAAFHDQHFEQLHLEVGPARRNRIVEEASAGAFSLALLRPLHVSKLSFHAIQSIN